MSLIDRFRRQPDTDMSDKPERVPEPDDLRLRGQILPDDLFPEVKTDEQ